MRVGRAPRPRAPGCRRPLLTSSPRGCCPLRLLGSRSCHLPASGWATGHHGAKRARGSQPPASPRPSAPGGSRSRRALSFPRALPERAQTMRGASPCPLLPETGNRWPRPDACWWGPAQPRRLGQRPRGGPAHPAHAFSPERDAVGFLRPRPTRHKALSPARVSPRPPLGWFSFDKTKAKARETGQGGSRGAQVGGLGQRPGGKEQSAPAPPDHREDSGWGLGVPACLRRPGWRWLCGGA